MTPLSARPDGKKIILVLTARRIENASGSSADWAAKTDFLVGRFIEVTPHAGGEAEHYNRLLCFFLLTSV